MGKLKLLQYTFSEWYRNIIEASSQFRVELENGKIYEVRALKMEELDDYADIVDQPITFTQKDNIAVIKIPSFANSYLKTHSQKFKREIKSIQKIISERQLETILLDIRGNTGGSDSNPAWLSSLFFTKPYKYWDRIEVNEPIAKDISGLSRVFYGKPTYQEGKWLWSDKGFLSKEFSYTKQQKPAPQTINGKTYILTDGMCFSSCSDFVAIMQANNKAVIIGEETGGGYQGNTSGLIPSERLACGLVVSVPLLKYVNKVPEDKNIGRGTLPDVELPPTFMEVSNDDAYLKRVIESIHANLKVD